MTRFDTPPGGIRASWIRSFVSVARRAIRLLSHLGLQERTLEWLKGVLRRVFHLSLLPVLPKRSPRSLEHDDTAEAVHLRSNVDDLLVEYDSKTRRWVKNVLADGPARSSPFESADHPEGICDEHRLRGVLPALARLNRVDGPPVADSALRALIEWCIQRTDGHPHWGWDTTNAALRLATLLETDRILGPDAPGLPSLGCTRRFLQRHRSVLHLGRVVEPSGNHTWIAECGRAALWLLLHPGRPLSHEALDRLLETWDDQLLSDGGHSERVPHYHLQAVSLLRLVAAADEQRRGRVLRSVEERLARATQALRQMIVPSGGLLRWGDLGRSWSGRTQSAELDLLSVDAPQPERLSHLEDFGLANLRWSFGDIEARLSADLGRHGHPVNPGHAHADWFNFSLFVGGNAVITDPGTLRYSDVPESQWFKTEDAHSTVVWPKRPWADLRGFYGWRLPPTKLATKVGRTDDGPLLEGERAAEHSSGSWRRHLRRYRPLHSSLQITDIVSSDCVEPSISQLVFGVGSRVTESSRDMRRFRIEGSHPPLRVEFDGPDSVVLDRRQVPFAPEYGRKEYAENVRARFIARRDPVQLQWRIEHAQ